MNFKSLNLYVLIFHENEILNSNPLKNIMKSMVLGYLPLLRDNIDHFSSFVFG